MSDLQRQVYRSSVHQSQLRSQRRERRSHYHCSPTPGPSLGTGLRHWRKWWWGWPGSWLLPQALQAPILLCIHWWSYQWRWRVQRWPHPKTTSKQNHPPGLVHIWLCDLAWALGSLPLHFHICLFDENRKSLTFLGIPWPWGFDKSINSAKYWFSTSWHRGGG